MSYGSSFELDCVSSLYATSSLSRPPPLWAIRREQNSDLADDHFLAETAQTRWLTAFSSASWRPETGCGSIWPDVTRDSRSANETPPPLISAPNPELHPA